MDIVPFDQSPRQVERDGGIGVVVAGNETNLTVVDSIARVDHVEIRRFGLSDCAKFGQIPRIRHEIADADSVSSEDCSARSGDIALNDVSAIISASRSRHATFIPRLCIYLFAATIGR